MLGTENLNVGRHVIQFSGRDEEPAPRVADYLSGTTRTFAFSREAPAAARHFAVATVSAWGPATSPTMPRWW